MVVKTKVFAFAMIIMLLMTGCSNFEKDQLAVYSFSGENDQFFVSNGVFILDEKDEIIDCGDFKASEEFFDNIKAYKTTFYIMSDNERKIIITNSVEDMSGGILNPPSDLGKTSGDKIIISNETDYNDLINNLYFELVTVDIDGKENVYQLQMIMSEVIKSDN